jgi:hypothetical protein
MKRVRPRAGRRPSLNAFAAAASMNAFAAAASSMSAFVAAASMPPFAAGGSAMRRFAAAAAIALLLAACGGGTGSAAGADEGERGGADRGASARKEHGVPGSQRSVATDEPAPAAPGVEIGVELRDDEQRRLGLELAPLERAEYESRIEGIGLVVDVQSVVQRMSALSTAEAAAERSQAALTRARGLFKADAAVSREALETAQSQAAADAAALDLARTQAAGAFGYTAPWLDSARRDELLRALSAGRAVVIRASFPGGLPNGITSSLTVRRVGADSGSDEWTAKETWTGPADPNVPGPVLFAYLDEAGGLVAGERVVASVPDGAKLDGVIVPASSIVIAGGTAWCYLLMDGDRFVREPVDLERPFRGGYFEPNDAALGSPLEPTRPALVAGRRVVVAGAGLLLARETGGGEEEAD